MRLFAIALLGLAVPCLAAACSSAPPPEPSTPPPASATAPGDAPASTAAVSAPAAEVPRADFVARLAKVICEGSAPCCDATGAVYDPAYCAAEVAEPWNEALAEAKHYDGKSAARCLDDVRAVAADCSAAKADVLELPACAGALAGPGKTGDPCESKYDCAAPPRGVALCWTGLTGEDPGRCGASTPPEKGAACFTPLAEKEDKSQLVFSECTEDPKLRCDPATRICGPRVGSGGACEQSYECEEGALCLGGKCRPTMGVACKRGLDCAEGQTCIGGTCGAGKKLGESCGGLGECAGGMCAANTRRCSTWAATFLCKAPAR